MAVFFYSFTMTICFWPTQHRQRTRNWDLPKRWSHDQSLWEMIHRFRAQTLAYGEALWCYNSTWRQRHSCHVDTGGGVCCMLRGFERAQMAVVVMQWCQTQSKRQNDKTNKNDTNKLLPILRDEKGALSHITNRVIKPRTQHIDHLEDRSTRSSRKPRAYGRRHWSWNLYSCIWISHVNGMAVPYQATDCTPSLFTAANWTRVLMRLRRFHSMDVWHDVWNNVRIVWFSCSTERSKRGKCYYMIWEKVAAALRSPNWLTDYGLIVIYSATSLHLPPPLPLVFGIMSFHGPPWCSRLSCI